MAFVFVFLVVLFFTLLGTNSSATHASSLHDGRECNFHKGAGTFPPDHIKHLSPDGKKTQMGTMSEDKCIETCVQLKKQDDSVNGVSFNDGNRMCSCVSRMNGRDDTTNAKSCFIETQNKDFFKCADSQEISVPNAQIRVPSDDLSDDLSNKRCLWKIMQDKSGVKSIKFYFFVVELKNAEVRLNEESISKKGSKKGKTGHAEITFTRFDENDKKSHIHVIIQDLCNGKCGIGGLCDGNKCSCYKGYSGTNCEKDDWCSWQCVYGLCTGKNNVCTCDSGYEGNFCQHLAPTTAPATTTAPPTTTVPPTPAFQGFTVWVTIPQNEEWHKRKVRQQEGLRRQQENVQRRKQQQHDSL